jgi:hypothetical protein
MNASRVWWPQWLLANLSANETNDACVFPSSHGPRADQTGRMHISDFRNPRTSSIAKRNRSIHRGHFQTHAPQQKNPHSDTLSAQAASRMSRSPTSGAGACRKNGKPIDLGQYGYSN